MYNYVIHVCDIFLSRSLPRKKSSYFSFNIVKVSFYGGNENIELKDERYVSHLCALFFKKMINYLFDEFFLSKLFSHNKLTTEFKLFFNKILSHTYCAMHITIIWLISKLYHLLKMFLFAVNLFPRHEHLVSHSSMCTEKSFSLKTKTHKASVREGCTCAFGERRITCKNHKNRCIFI